jgi:hypothetical protein
MIEAIGAPWLTSEPTNRRVAGQELRSGIGAESSAFHPV